MAPRISDRAHLLCFLDSDAGHLIDTRGGAREEDYAARLHTPIAKDLIEGRGSQWLSSALCRPTLLEPTHTRWLLLANQPICAHEEDDDGELISS
jgi:hypothetical protein